MVHAVVSERGALAGFRQWRRDTVKNLFGKLIWWCERFVVRYSTVPDLPVFDPDEFAWTGLLEANADTIRRECEAVLEFGSEIPSFHELSPDQASISDDDRWKTYFLYAMGEKAEGNCGRCPVTAEVLERIPGMTTAFFSILAPGKRIPAHRGVFKGFVRCHLALRVPKEIESCFMRVGEGRLHWDDGKCVVFDDTYDHEVRNDTDEMRVVLLVDVVRPMRRPARWLTRVLMWVGGHTAYVRDARKNYFAWEKRFDRAWKQGVRG
jgi:aspartyl/asparaginyl beta-hydroxylase (cupin superfamily)